MKFREGKKGGGQREIVTFSLKKPSKNWSGEKVRLREEKKGGGNFERTGYL